MLDTSDRIDRDDDVDRSPVTILRHDGRRGISDIAVELGLSRATVRSRIGRMERLGEIIGYTVILRADAVAMPVRGLTMIEVEGRRTAQAIDALAGFQEVWAVHMANGKWDIVAVSLTDPDAVLRKLRLVPGITGSETSLLLATPRSTRAPLLRSLRGGGRGGADRRVAGPLRRGLPAARLMTLDRGTGARTDPKRAFPRLTGEGVSRHAAE